MNSGENFLRFLVTRSRSFPEESYWIPCPGTGGQLNRRSAVDRDLGIRDAQAALLSLPAAYLQRPWQSFGFYDNDDVRLTLTLTGGEFAGLTRWPGERMAP